MPSLNKLQPLPYAHIRRSYINFNTYSNHLRLWIPICKYLIMKSTHIFTIYSLSKRPHQRRRPPSSHNSGLSTPHWCGRPFRLNPSRLIQTDQPLCLHFSARHRVYICRRFAARPLVNSRLAAISINAPYHMERKTIINHTTTTRVYPTDRRVWIAVGIFNRHCARIALGSWPFTRARLTAQRVASCTNNRKVHPQPAASVICMHGGCGAACIWMI